MPSFTFSSDLSVSVDEFLATLTMRGVNAELSPLVTMTVPDTWSRQSILQWPQQQHLFRSWILLFGFLPIDRHSVYFDAIRPGEGFAERSSSVMNAFWCHERKVVVQQSGCRVTDTVLYESRVPFLGVMLRPIYEAVFRRRHQNLRSRYGGRASEQHVARDV